MPLTSVVVVTFNSESTLRECLRSIPGSCEVVVVDQQSSDGSVSVATDTRPDAKVIKAGGNRGFGAGCNLGAANATGDVLVFLNPDASFMSSECVQILSELARSQNAMVGPRILDSAGIEQTRARYWSSIWSELGEVFLPEKLTVGRLRRDIPVGDDIYRSGGPVPYVQGSCMAIGAESFWRVNGFDERFFLYREEEILALRLRDIGVTTFLEPRATITHIGGKSTQQLRDFAAGQYYRSEALFYSIHYSRPVATMAVVALWFALMTMAAITPVRRRIGPRTNNGYRWYRCAAAGAISGWRRTVVEPPLAQPPAGSTS